MTRVTQIISLIETEVKEGSKVESNERFVFTNGKIETLFLFYGSKSLLMSFYFEKVSSFLYEETQDSLLNFLV